MKNVAVFGGSFNPPHIGHGMVVSHIHLNDPTIELVLVVPCYKQRGKELVDFDRRVEYCEAAFGWLPCARVSLVERGTSSITLETMRTLKQIHPDWNLRFVMGGDLLASAASWDGWDELKDLAPPLIVGRAGVPSYDTPTPICPAVSSSIIREGLWDGRYHDVERYLPKGVLNLIREDENYLNPMLRRTL